MAKCEVQVRTTSPSLTAYSMHTSTPGVPHAFG